MNGLRRARASEIAVLKSKHLSAKKDKRFVMRVTTSSFDALVARLAVALSAAMLVGVDRAYGQTSPGSGSDTGLSSILQGLSPDQRQSIEQQIGTTGLGGAPGGQGTRVLPETEEQQSLMLQQQRQTLLDQEKQRAEMQRLSPFLEANDWIVITVDSNPLPAANRPPPSLTPAARHSRGPRPASSKPFLAVWPRRSAELRAPRPRRAARPAPAAARRHAAAAALGPNQPQYATAGATRPCPLARGSPTATLSQYPQPQLTEEEQKQRQALIDLIRAKNPYQLSRDGVLMLPGFAPIPLAGLTDQLATLRLGVEPALRDLYIRVTKLPLMKQGAASLKPFGYDLFDHQISTFAPATNVPVPADYVVGPGDELDVQLYGSRMSSSNS